MQTHRTRRIIPLLALAVMTTAVAACGDSGDDSSPGANNAETIKLAAPVELTGPAAAFGKPYLDGLQAAVDQVNDSGGIKALDGAKLELLVEDTQSDPQKVGQLIRKGKSEGAVAAVGPLTSASMVAAKPTFIQVGLPWVGPGGVPALTEGETDGNIWQIAGFTTTYATNAMEFLAEEAAAGKIKVKKIGIVHVSAPPGPDVADALAKAAEASGWEVVRAEYDLRKTKDFGPIVAKLKAAGVDTVTGLQYPGDAALFAQAVELQKWQPANGFIFVQGAQGFPSFASQLGSSVEGWIDASYGASQTQCISPEAKAVAEKYKANTGDVMTMVSTLGPEVIQIIVTALEKGGGASIDQVKKGLPQVELEGCSGLNMAAGGVKFSEAGANTLARATMTQIESPSSFPAVWPKEVAVQDAKWPAG